MLVTSIFSFSHNVFRKLLFQGHKNFGLCSKELALSHMTNLIEWSKLKAFTGNDLNVDQMIIYVLDKAEKMVGNGENAGNQILVLCGKGLRQCSC